MHLDIPKELSVNHTETEQMLKTIVVHEVMSYGYYRLVLDGKITSWWSKEDLICLWWLKVVTPN